MGLSKKKKAKMLEDVCLHCGFFQLHKDKWPDWRPDKDNPDPTAFNDLVHSAVNIVAELFTMLDESDRMKFFIRVNERLEAQPDLREALERIKAAIGPTKGPVKH